MAVDISKLPPPPKGKVDISNLPPPPSASSVDISALPPPPPPGMDEDYKAVRGIIDRSFWAAPLVESEQTTDRELEAIARHHGVDPASFKEMSTYFGALRGKGDTAGELESSAARGIGFNIPQFVAKKSLDDPKLKAAIDDLQDLADAKRSFARGLAENLVPVGAVGKAVAKGAGLLAKEGAEAGLKQAAKQAAGEGAAVGATAGLARSKEDEELRSTILGAGLGGTLGVGATAVGKGVSKFNDWSTAERELTEAALRQPEVDVNGAAQKIAQSTADAEKVIENVVLREAELTPETADTVTKQLVNDWEMRSQDLDGVASKRAVNEIPDIVQTYGSQRAKAVLKAKDIAEERIFKFAKELSDEQPKDLEEARGLIAEYSARQGGQEDLANRYRSFVQKEQRDKAISDNVLSSTSQGGWFTKALNFISDAQFVLRGIDNTYNVGAEKTHHALNRNYNRLTYAKAGFQSQLHDLYKTLPKGSSAKIVDALDGKQVALNPAEQVAADKARQYLDNFLDFVNGSVKAKDSEIAPLSIPKLKDYFPHILKDTNELISGFEKLKAEALAEASRMYGRRITDLSQINPSDLVVGGKYGNKPLQALIDGLKVFDATEIRTPRDLSARFKTQLYHRDGNISMESKARAAMERKDSMPEWMQERDLFKALDKYTSNTLRHLYLRKPLDELVKIADNLRSAKADIEEKYIRDLVQDLKGIRKGTAASAALQLNLKFRSALDETITKYGKDSLQGSIATVLKSAPDFFNLLLRQVYPNYLGLSPRAFIQNSTQLITKTIPELGAVYGPVAALRAGVGAVLNLPTNLKRLKQMGLAPESFTARHREYVAEGLAASLPARLTGRALQNVSDATLFFYSKLDNLNRAFTLSIADQMTYDLMRGSKLANGALQKMPPAIQREALQAVVNKDQQGLNRLLAEYLNASTQYNYNRASLSEFGRTMGPLFSTFSKWPTATAGDMINEFREKGLLKGGLRNAEKYVLPWMLLQGFDSMILGEEAGEDPTDRQKLLTGKHGLSASAPIGTVKSIVTGDFFTPPAVDAFIKGAIVPMMEQDSNKLAKGLQNAMESFMPGYVLYRFFTEDMPTITTGHRPEK